MNRCSLLGLAALLLSAPTAQAFINVTAANGKLVVEGDGGSDTVDIDGVAAVGGVRVRINGGFSTTFGGIRDVKVKLGPGDDHLKVHGLSIGGSFKAQLGEGDDVFVIDNTLPLGVVLSVFIGGNVQVGMGGQSGDLAEVRSTDPLTSIHIGGRVRIRDAADVDLKGDGTSHELEAADVTIGGDLIIDSPFSADVNSDAKTVDIDNVNVGGATSIGLGAGPDKVELSDNHFAREVEIQTGGGDDLLALIWGGEFNQFDSSLVASGQAGNDTVDDDPNNNYATPPVFKGFEAIL